MLPPDSMAGPFKPASCSCASAGNSGSSPRLNMAQAARVASWLRWSLSAWSMAVSGKLSATILRAHSRHRVTGMPDRVPGTSTTLDDFQSLGPDPNLNRKQHHGRPVESQTQRHRRQRQGQAVWQTGERHHDRRAQRRRPGGQRAPAAGGRTGPQSVHAQGHAGPCHQKGRWSHGRGGELRTCDLRRLCATPGAGHGGVPDRQREPHRARNARAVPQGPAGHLGLGGLGF